MIRKYKHCRQIKWTAAALALLLTGCAARTVRAQAGQTVSTALFDFTVSDPQTLTEYPGVTVSEGEQLASMMLTVTNTGTETLPFFSPDFQFQWGEGDKDFGVCLDGVDDRMLPYAWDLEPGETRTGLVLVPRDCTGLTVAYEELGEDGSRAGTYFVEVPL